MESMPAAHFGNFARSCFNRSTSGENRCGSCFEKASRSNSPSHTEGGSWPVPRKNVLSVRFGSNDSGTAKLSELRRRSIESKRSTTPSLQQTAYLYCVLACFVGPDANRFFDCVHEDLSISDFAGLGRLYDCCRDVFHHAVRKDHFDLDLWHKVEGVFTSTINFCVAFLTTKPFYFCNCHSIDPEVG